VKKADPGSKASGVADVDGIDVASSSISSLEFVGCKAELLVLEVEDVEVVGVEVDELVVLTALLLVVETTEDEVVITELVVGVVVGVVVEVFPRLTAAYAPIAIITITTTTMPIIAALLIAYLNFEILLRVIKIAK
jgi:hypothetical protein